MANDITHYDVVEAYCERLSYLPGEAARVCVSTSAPSYDVEVARWGASLERVWSTRGVVGREQPTPPDADARGCGWDVDVEIPIDRGWRSGFYLVTLTASEGPDDRRVGHAGFVVRASAPSAPILLVLATNTWNAYNDWGGRSLYTGGHQVSFRRPFGRGMLVRPEAGRADRKSPPRRPGEEPDVDGDAYQAYRFEHGYPGYMGSAGWFPYDRRFVEWAEGAGFELDYAVSSDLATVPGLTDGYRCVVGAGHDEYWSAAQRDAIERFVASGGNYASWSGNTMFWQVRLIGDAERDDAADADHEADHMVCHKYAAHEADPVLADDPTAMTGMFADPVVGRPESRFLGAGSMFGLYARFGQATPRGVGGFVVYRDDHWMLAGTGLRYGDVLGQDDAIVGYETVGTRINLDEVGLPVVVADPALPDPDDVEIVAFTPASNLGMGEYPKSIAALSDQGDLEFVADRIYGGGERARARARHGNSVLATCRPFGAAGGQVVVAGTTDWVFGLADPQVTQVTSNILHHLTT